MNNVKTTAAFVANLRYEDLPETSVRAAKQCVLDWFAAAIGGSQETAARILRETILPADGATDASLFGTNRQRAAAMHAAFLNGAAVCAGEFAPRVPVIAAAASAFAAAEKERRNGRELLTAIVAGCELAARLGETETLSPDVSGGGAEMVAAASAARALGLSPEQTVHALKLAEAQATGAERSDGAATRLLRIGKACYEGVLSAYLANAGFTGAAQAPDGENNAAPDEPRIFPAASSWEESRRRFLALSAPVVGEARASRLAAFAETLDESEDVAASLRELL